MDLVNATVSTDLVTRLRESKRCHEAAAMKAGRDVGEVWIGSAEYAEVKRLQRHWDSVLPSDRYTLFQVPTGNNHTAAEFLVFAIRPETEGDSQAAEEFWQDLLGDDTSACNEAAFMEGFITGALECWASIRREVEDN